jgi:hypothetical protein
MKQVLLRDFVVCMIEDFLPQRNLILAIGSGKGRQWHFISEPYL